MTQPNHKSITRLLEDLHAGEAGAAQALLPMVYDQLHEMAARLFSSERREHTLQPTALIHEAWMKLAGHLPRASQTPEGRRHFYALAARAMRQVLGDHARRCRSQKRGDGGRRITLDEGSDGSPTAAFDLVDFDDSLGRLATLNARHAQVVELRILGGLTIAETALALEVSHSTVEADWFTAKAWLRRELAHA